MEREEMLTRLDERYNTLEKKVDGLITEISGLRANLSKEFVRMERFRLLEIVVFGFVASILVAFTQFLLANWTNTP